MKPIALFLAALIPALATAEPMLKTANPNLNRYVASKMAGWSGSADTARYVANQQAINVAQRKLETLRLSTGGVRRGFQARSGSWIPASAGARALLKTR